MALLNKRVFAKEEKAITVNDLAKVLSLLRQGLSINNTKQDAWHIMSFFGFGTEILDNVLEYEDRNLFYMLEDFKMGLLDTRREETTLYDGREWRINYWILNKERVFDILENVVSVIEYDDQEIKQKVDILNGLGFLNTIQQIPFNKTMLDCEYYGGTKETAEFFVNNNIINIDNLGNVKLLPSYFSFVKKTVGDFCDKDADVDTIHRTLTELNFSITFSELESILSRKILPREGKVDWKKYEKETRKAAMFEREIEKLDKITQEYDFSFYKSIITDNQFIKICETHPKRVKQLFEQVQNVYSCIDETKNPDLPVLQNADDIKSIEEYISSLIKVKNKKQGVYDYLFQLSESLPELIHRTLKTVKDETEQSYSVLGTQGAKIFEGEIWIGQQYSKFDNSQITWAVHFKDNVDLAEKYNISDLEEKVYQSERTSKDDLQSMYNLLKQKVDFNVVLKQAINSYKTAIYYLNGLKNDFKWRGYENGNGSDLEKITTN